MSMTGGITFFEKSKALFRDGATVVASSNNNDAKLALSMNRVFKWVSVGSDDTTTETITITLPSSVSISRIFLGGINFKEFTVKYGGGPTDFANVTGLDGALGGGIAETAYARAAAYYEFDAVTTDTIVITATKTQVADEEKELTLAIATNEIGTFTGYPDPNNAFFDRNERDQKVLSGLSHIVKSGEIFTMKLDMDNYPNQADITLLETLFDSEDPFLVWPNGGIPTQFRLTQKAWRVQDIYQMQTKGKMRSEYNRNIYISGVEKDASLVEVVA